VDKRWHLRSWRNAIAFQPPDYPDETVLERIVSRLADLPPLVSPEEVDHLKKQISEAALGKRFLLQAGDCAESFEKCTAKAINSRITVLQKMSLVLMHGSSLPVTTVGRIAGQYAKPRSNPEQTIDNQTLPSYRGDLINGHSFSVQSRTPDPERLLQGYGYASMTLNYIRTLKNGSLSKLKSSSAWQEPSLQKIPELFEPLQHIRQSINLAEQIQGAAISNNLYTSHEALHLYYEQALTRQHQGNWYNLSTHFPWVGARTAKPNTAQVEYLRGISNPVAIKISPTMEPQLLTQLIDKLNPQAELGKITLIPRFGLKHIQQLLPQFIETINQSGQPVLWSCDPMHGNTRSTSKGIKTRDVAAIKHELALSFDIHRQYNSNLGAVHLEVSGENVTECCGGFCQMTDQMLTSNYQSLVDPRLNSTQAMEIALFIKDQIASETKANVYLASENQQNS